MVEVFADTYALVAALRAAPSYRSIFETETIVTTATNVAELAYVTLRGGDVTKMARAVSACQPLIVESPRRAIGAAAHFKHERRLAGRPCSHVDAWGYATAQCLGLQFLTGDDDFRDVPGVRFVKA